MSKSVGRVVKIDEHRKELEGWVKTLKLRVAFQFVSGDYGAAKDELRAVLEEANTRVSGSSRAFLIAAIAPEMEVLSYANDHDAAAEELCGFYEALRAQI